VEHQAILEHAAEQLSALSDHLGLSLVGQQLVTETNRRLDAQRVRIAVLGEIKHGKSSLINALLQTPGLPVGVTPTTGTVIRVRAGETAGVYQVAPDGKRSLVDAVDFKPLVRGKKPLHGELEFVVETPKFPFAEHVELLDTPGINDIQTARGMQSRGHLARSDILVLVLDATQALNRSELGFLRDAAVAVGGFDSEQSGAEVLLVLNRIDLVAEEERSTVVDHVREQLSGLFSGTPEIFQTNARGALKEPEGGGTGVLEVTRLREYLGELAGRRESLLPRRARTALLRYTHLLRQNATIQARALTLEAGQLATEIADIEEALSQHKLDLDSLRKVIESGRKSILAASAERVVAYREQLESEAFAQLERADLRHVADVLPAAIHDSMMHFTYVEGQRIQDELDELTRQILKTHGEQARGLLAQAMLGFKFRGTEVRLAPPSVAIEAGMLTVSVIGTLIMYFGNFLAGMIVTTAGPLTTMALREKSVRNLRAAASRAIPKNLARDLKGLGTALEAAVEAYVKALEEHLILANSQLAEQLTAVLQRANRCLGIGDDLSDEDRERRRNASLAELTVLQGSLGALHTQLTALKFA